MLNHPIDLQGFFLIAVRVGSTALNANTLCTLRVGLSTNYDLPT